MRRSHSLFFVYFLEFLEGPQAKREVCCCFFFFFCSFLRLYKEKKIFRYYFRKFFFCFILSKMKNVFLGSFAIVEFFKILFHKFKLLSMTKFLLIAKVFATVCRISSHSNSTLRLIKRLKVLRVKKYIKS